MSATEDLKPAGDKIRATIRWICEQIRERPGKKRIAILREAELRFDLSPRECEFIETKLEAGPEETAG